VVILVARTLKNYSEVASPCRPSVVDAYNE